MHNANGQMRLGSVGSSTIDRFQCCDYKLIQVASPLTLDMSWLPSFTAQKLQFSKDPELLEGFQQLNVGQPWLTDQILGFTAGL